MSASFDSTSTLPTVRQPSAVELRRKAHSRIAERIDPVRTRHKPLSILRQEAKRILDQFLDQEASYLTRSDREKFTEDVLAEAPGISVLEDLYRDDAIKEILIITHNQIIGKKNDVWLPTSVRFRDLDQLRTVLAYFTHTGEHLVPPGPATSGLDLRLPNGFRLMAITPPAVMELSPQVLLIRSGAPAATPASSISGPASGAIHITPSPRTASTASNAGTVSVSLDTRNGSGGSGVVQLGAPLRPGEQASGRLGPTLPAPVTSVTDPFAKFRQKVSERIVFKFASAGMYDLNQVPLADLRRIVLAHVVEYCEQEKFGYDETTQERLALEILANMNR
jgi:pilus assembly protein CpaF